VFFIDESGGAVFRQSNTWELGNWVSGEDGGPHEARTSTVLELNDEEDLLGFSTQITSLNRRDRIFVVNVEKGKGAVVKGYDPYPSGTRRISGWSDQRFTNQAEVDTMASLIAVRQALKMRSATVEIPGYPAIQLDDQVIVKEQITGTDNLFYVDAIASNYDALTGRFTYSMTLLWLGSPGDMMTADDFKDSMLDNAQSYISALKGFT
jgi:hypothetical protein